MNWRALSTLFTRSRERNWRFSALIGVLYVAFLIWMHVHHEMWRDEIHVWTLARQADGFLDIASGDRVYEGHPPLWYCYLYAWTFITKQPWGLDAATVLAASVAALALLRFAPFPRWLKVMLLCSYFFGYEYTVMSRGYVLDWLFSCLFCAFYDIKRSRAITWGFLLALLALSDVYGLFLSVSLLSFLVLDNTFWSRSKGYPKVWRLSFQPRFVVGLLVAGGGLLLSAAMTNPPEPNPFSPDWHPDSLNLKALPEMAGRVIGGLLPLCKSELTFWDTQRTLWQDPSWSVYVAIGLLVALVLSLLPAWRAMLAFILGTTLCAVFQQIRYGGYARHWGHYLVLAIVFSWLARVTYPRRRFVISTLLLAGVLAFGVQGFLVATESDARWVFSGGRETAAFIREHGLQDLPIVAGPDWFVITVTGYLERPFVRVETDEFHDTVLFHGRRRGFSERALLERAAAVSREERSPVLVVSNQRLAPAPHGTTLTWLYTSEPSTVPDEVFSVYRLNTK